MISLKSTVYERCADAAVLVEHLDDGIERGMRDVVSTKRLTMIRPVVEN